MLPEMRLAAVTLLAALAAAVALAVSAGSTGTISGPISLIGTVKEHHVFTASMRFPDRESWYFNLASARRPAKALGYGILACGFLSIHSSIRQCNGTFSLPRGKIVVAGSFLYSTFYQLALTGGTELYTAAGGNLVARRFYGRTDLYRFDFTLR